MTKTISAEQMAKLIGYLTEADTLLSKLPHLRTPEDIGNAVGYVRFVRDRLLDASGTDLTVIPSYVEIKTQTPEATDAEITKAAARMVNAFYEAKRDRCVAERLRQNHDTYRANLLELSAINCDASYAASLAAMRALFGRGV